MEDAVGDAPFWHASVEVPPQYRKRRACIEGAELRGITPAQVGDLAALVRRICDSGPAPGQQGPAGGAAWQDADMHFVSDHVVEPLTRPFPCSFVELVAQGPQVPTWFASHFWGARFAETVAMLTYHAESRKLARTAAYWVDAFAIDQHQHSFSEFGGDLRETPFARAILSSECVGTVTLFDHEAALLQRAWCLLESFVSTGMAKEGKEYLNDLAAFLQADEQHDGTQSNPAAPVLRLDSGGGGYQTVSKGDWSFPPTVDDAGVRQDITLARASRPGDRLNILRMVGGDRDGFNRQVRQPFAEGAVRSAAMRNNVAGLRGLLADFPEQVALPPREEVHVCIAARLGHGDCVAALLEARVDPNMQDKFGYTPIMATVREGHNGILGALLGARADPTIPAHHGYTPILGAARKGHLECLRTLLGVRVDPDTADIYGYTPSHGAVLSGQVHTLRLLLEARADPSVPQRKGVTPVVSAVQSDHPLCLCLLLEASADPGARGKDGNTPVMYAVRNKTTDCLCILLEARAETNARNSSGDTPIHVATQKGSPDCLRMLLEAKADPNTPMNGNMKPMVLLNQERNCSCMLS